MTTENSQEQKEEEKGKKVTMLLNVKHGDGSGEIKTYEKGKKYKLSKELTELFTLNNWAE